MFRLTMNLEFTPLSHVVSVYPIGGNLTVNTSMITCVYDFAPPG